MNKDIEKRLSAIESRNSRVQDDKAWEISWTRRISIMLLTYIVVCVYLRYVVHIDPWINALVPVIGFLLSTLTITRVKALWLKHRQK